MLKLYLDCCLLRLLQLPLLWQGTGSDFRRTFGWWAPCAALVLHLILLPASLVRQPQLLQLLQLLNRP
jgi:hypothetical protein